MRLVTDLRCTGWDDGLDAQNAARSNTDKAKQGHAGPGKQGKGLFRWDYHEADMSLDLIL